MSIAENIKKIRLEHGLSQTELGKIAGVSDKAVSTWELGTKIPRMGAVEKMANYFGIPKSAIVDDAPAATPSRPIPPGFQPMPEMDWGAAGRPDRLRDAHHGGRKCRADGLCAFPLALHLYADLQGRQHGAPHPRR